MRGKENMVGTKEGDIYSFAIVCSELITRKPAWNIGEVEYTEERRRLISGIVGYSFTFQRFST